MTAQVDTYKVDPESTNLIGQDWEKFFDSFSNKEPGAAFDGGGSIRQYRSDDNSLRSLHDVKRLRHKDMNMFGRSPETDLFYTVVCSICSMILIPQALKHHIQKRHGDADRLIINNNMNEKLECSIKNKQKKVPVIAKIENKIEKQRKIKSTSSSPPDLTEEKRAEKGRKSKLSPERTVPPELEPMTILPLSTSSRSDKRKQKLVANPISEGVVELQPIVALSPIMEKAAESEAKEIPKKNKKKSGEKKERVDKVYDPNKHCGVVNSVGKPCLRSILCKVHQVALKRAVENRSMPYDALIKLIKSHNDDDKKVEELLRPKMEVSEVPHTAPILISADVITAPILPRLNDVKPTNLVTLTSANAMESLPVQLIANVPLTTTWPTTTEQIKVNPEEPASKRLKIKEKDEEIEQPLVLSSDLDALIEQTLWDVSVSEPIPLIPTVPKPEPILRWSSEPPSPRKSSTPPPHIDLEDVHWHTNHPKPLAVNTFGCRLIGGLMSTCKKLDSLRKHLQNVWSSSTSTIKNSFSDIYGTNNPQNPNSNIKNNFTPINNKFIKLKVNKTTNVPKKNIVPITKTVSTKRKRKSNTILTTNVQNTSTNASDIISGLLIGNAVPIQRSAAVPNATSGVIPVNTINGNGVPLGLFQGSLPVIASTAPNQSATFIQLNLCPPK